MKRKNITVFLLVFLLFSLPAASVFSASNPYIASHGINFAIGNKYYEQTDIILNGPVSSLSFTRHYNSQSTVDTDMGYGWSHSFADKISVTSNVISYTRPDGRVEEYPYDSGSASWLKETGEVAKFTEEADGYYLQEPNGAVKKFDLTSKKLLELIDRNGNNITLTYSAGQTNIEDNFGQQLTLSFDVNGLLETLSTPLGNITYSYSFGNLDKVYRPDSTTIYEQYSYAGTDLTGMTNEAGDTMFSVGYTSGRVTSSSLQGGINPISIDYQAEDLVVVTDETDQIETIYNLTFKYGIAQVESFSGPGCFSCSLDTGSQYTYNDKLQVTTSTNANGVQTSFLYDDNGNRSSVTEATGTPLQRTSTYLYDLNTNFLSTVTRDSIANTSQQTVIAMIYDANGNLLSKTESGYNGMTPVNRGSDYTYDSYGRVESINGPRVDVSDIITFSYYFNDPLMGTDQGRLHTISNGLGQTITYSNYNGFGKAEQVVDSNNIITLLSYNSHGLIAERITANRSTVYNYDLAGMLTTVTLPGGRTINYDYITSGQVSRITDSLGNYISYSYDNKGKRTGQSIYDPTDTLTSSLGYEYDNAGRLYKTIQPDSSFEELNYNDVNRLVSRTNQLGKTTNYSYDELNRLTAMTAPGTVITAFSYDSHDNQSSITNPEGVITSFIYDDFNRRVSRVSTDTGTTLYSYDNAGNLIGKTDANSIEITYTYDILNRLLSISYPDFSRNIAYSYDQGVYGVGHLTGMTDSTGSSSYSYDQYGNLTMETRSINGLGFSIGYSYNENSELASITYPSSRVVTYHRDIAGQITSLVSNYQGDTTTLSHGITYLPFGPRTSLNLGNGMTTSNEYDQLYRLTSTDSDNAYNRSYSYLATGQVETITDNISEERSQSYTYDDLGRLTNAQGIYGTMAFSYDTVGNRLSKTVDSIGESYSYITGSNKINQVSGETVTDYGYDLVGNVTTKGDVQLNWSDDNRLLSVLEDGSEVGAYGYDGHGLRRIKSTPESSVLSLYNSAGNLLAETNAMGNTLREHVYLDGQRISLFTYPDSDTSIHQVIRTLQILCGIEGTTNLDDLDLSNDGKVNIEDVILSLQYNSELQPALLFYIISDHLRTAQLLTDAQGQVVWQGNYSPFGTVDVVVDQLESTLRFPGQHYDTETGLHYNWHRFYDPSTGRYISADPIGLAGGINLYLYANANPIMFIDPKGLACGAAGSDWVVPDSPGGFDYTRCCEEHDKCYADCNKTKEQCDEEFRECMYRRCRYQHGGKKCVKWAERYWLGVDRLGQGAYDNAQNPQPAPSINPSTDGP